jgi:tRNA nucleotidyltransferase (CCA-adding enzyme)
MEGRSTVRRTVALASEHIPDPVLKVLRRLRERGFQAYLVGGAVRDMVRYQKPAGDFDIATNARPEDVQRTFPKTIPTGIQHGTVTVLSEGHHVEVTTFRTEGDYLDARRPSSVEFRSDVREDLARRDFTINAMAYDPLDGTLVDPFGGQEDLEAGIIRCVGNPTDRFSEDGLRPLRAVRFAAVLGFALDPATEAAIPGTLPSFRKVAMERVREEFTRLLLSERPAFGLELLHQSGLLGSFLHELESCSGQGQDDSYPGDVFRHALAATELTPASLEVRLAALLHDIAKPRTAQPSAGGFRFPDHDRLGERMVREVLQRLKYPTRTIETVAPMVREHLLDEDARWTDGALRRFVARLGEPLLDPFFEFLEANRAARTDGERRRAQVQKLRQRIARLLAHRPPLSAKALALNGNQIMRVLGVGPSPAVGEATRFLIDQVLEDPSLNTPQRLTELLQTWARERGV